MRKTLQFIFILFLLSTEILSAQNTYEIKVSQNNYSPKTVNCNIGDTVRFIWVSGNNPTRSDDGQSIPTFNVNANNPVKTLVMNSSGSIPFYSTTHGQANGGGMSGQINVSTSTSLLNKSLVSSLTVFPNPANDKISVNFVVKKESNVVIKLLDILGNDIAVLANDRYTSGEYKQSFAVPAKVTKGLFFVKVSIGSEVAIKRISIQ